jgi:hypothetical protein
MNLLSELKTMMGHGCMPICIARKATRIMQPTGIAGPVSPSVGNFLMQNGEASQKTCFGATSSSSLQKASMLAFSGDIELRSAFRKKSPTKLKLWTGSGTTLHLF